MSSLKARGYRIKPIAATSQHEPAPPVADWICNDVTIENPQQDRQAIIPFELWPLQRSSLDAILNHRQVIVLKARQLGLSWLVICYAVWLCVFHPGQAVLVFSKDQESANEMIRRARGVFLRLKRKPVELTTDNVTTIGWANGSRVKSFAATEDAGSSFTASLILVDEFAKMRYADSLYTSVKPTINDGGRIIVISTARGEGNPFHKLWNAAVAGENGLHPIFLSWNARPGRDGDWYARAASDALSMAHHRQEYPATPDEAFVSIEEERFLPSMVWWDVLKEALPPVTRRDPMVLAMDAATGRAASVSDCFGIVGVTRHPARNGDVAVRFVAKWQARAGHAIDFQGNEQAPGPEMVVRRLCKELNVVEVCFDPTQLHDMATRLRREGIAKFYEFSQSAMRAESDKMLYDLITQKRLAHDGNVDLRQHIDNADRKADNQDRKMRIVKREESLKIDLAICVGMSAYRCLYLNL